MLASRVYAAQMEVTLVVDDALAAELAKGTARELEAALSRFGASVRALHPGNADPQLRRYFVASAPEAALTQLLCQELARLTGVEAAYIKPDASLP